MTTAQQHVEQAKAFLTSNRVKEAEAALRKAIALDRKEIPARVELARILGASGRLDEFNKLIEEVLSMAPGDSDALTLKGLHLIMQENYHQAIELFRRALESNARHTTAQVNLGLALREVDELDEAEAILRKAVTANPRSPQALFELAHTLAVKQRNEEALRVLMQLIRSSPNYSRAYIAIAGLYRNSDRLDDAIKICQQGLSTNPQALNIAVLLKDLYWQKEDYTPALHVMGQVCARRGASQDFIDLGDLAFAADKPELAKDAYEDAIDADAKNWLAYCALAEFHDSQNHAAEAMKNFEIAIRLNPHTQRPYNSMGLLLIKTDKADKAVEAFQQACRCAPDDSTPRYNLGLALAKLNKLTAAREQFQIALDQTIPGDFRDQIAQVLEAVEREMSAY